MSPTIPNTPEVLDKIVDVVLAHKPKPAKARATKKRKKPSSRKNQEKNAGH